MMLPQEIFFCLFFCSVHKSRREGFPEEEKEQGKSNKQILFPDAALSKTERLLQAVYIAYSWIWGGRGITVICSEAAPVTYFYNAHSIIDKVF